MRDDEQEKYVLHAREQDAEGQTVCVSRTSIFIDRSEGIMILRNRTPSYCLLMPSCSWDRVVVKPLCFPRRNDKEVAVVVFALVGFYKPGTD